MPLGHAVYQWNNLKLRNRRHGASKFVCCRTFTSRFLGGSQGESGAQRLSRLDGKRPIGTLIGRAESGPQAQTWIASFAARSHAATDPPICLEGLQNVGTL